MELWLYEISFSIVIIFLCVIYYYLTLNFDFWKKRGVRGPKPIPLIGNFLDVFLGKVHFSQLLTRFYNEFKDEPMIGIYTKSNPGLVLRDLDLIKDVLIKDFNVFCDRGMFSSKNDPLSQNLLNLEHERWQPLRNKLSPVFTSGKLKEMFYLMADCGDHFEKYLEKLVDNGFDDNRHGYRIVECRELTAKFTIQNIGTCVFGLDTKSIAEEISEFRKFGRMIFDDSPGNVLRRLLQQFAPFFFEFLGPFRYNPGMGFFIKSMKETIDYRKRNLVRRNDFVDLLMDLQDQPEQLENIDFNHRFLTGQALVFFAAGFETSSTTMSNVFYELAFNHEIQDKLRREIRIEIEKNEGKLTYESIKKMIYLDKVVKESLRKYPPGSILRRKSCASYTFANTNFIIPKDTMVFIPVWAIHRDPNIYPNPEKFDPERFDKENESQRHPMAYLPFGDGPHNCIGLRFANYQAKIGIIAVVNKFKLEVCDETCKTYDIEPRSVIPAPKGGICLKISKAM